MYYIYQSITVGVGKNYAISFDWSADAESTVYYGFTSLAKMLAGEIGSVGKDEFNDVRQFNVALAESGTKTDTLTADAESEIFYIGLYPQEGGSTNKLTVDNVSVREIL